MRRKLSQSEIFQEIDLGDLLGRTPTQDEARAFAQEAIERIIERSQSGIDRNGNRFRSYTEDYADEKGVSRSDVDMTLLGDMLLSIGSSVNGDRVKIEIPASEAPKAYGHITGFKGHPTIPQGKYKRDFFGLTRDEAEQIADSIKDQSFQEETLDVFDILSRIGLVAESGN